MWLKDGDSLNCYNCKELKMWPNDVFWNDDENIICNDCFFPRCEKCEKSIDDDEVILLYSEYVDFPSHCVACIIKERYNLDVNLNIYQVASELDSINVEDEKLPEKKETKNTSTNKNGNNFYKLNSYLQYKINKLKNKIKNKTLDKNISFRLNGKKYNFVSNFSDLTNKLVETKYPKSKYFEKYKLRITDEDIKLKDDMIKNNESKNKLFWTKYNESKNKYNDKIISLFKDDPVIEFDKESFYKKYNGKHYSCIYKDIIFELDNLEKDYKNIKIIETYYNKLKDDINITTIFKSQNSKINKLFTDYENNIINEYNVLKEIGNLFINNNFTKDEIQEINSINQNSRPYRILKQSKRVYLLEKFVDIKYIALAGISNWLRDTSDNNFEILLSYFNKNNNIDESDDEIQMEYEPPKLNFNIDMHDMPFVSDED